MRATTRFTLRGAAVIAFALALSPSVFCQNAELEKAKQAEMERRAGEAERQLSAWELRMAEVRRPPERHRDANLAYAQIREDYKQIQVVNNDLALVVSKGGALDLKYVEKAVAEIKKRAGRLKENLMLPDDQILSEREKTVARTEAEQLKHSLVALDNLVMAFVNNPIFDQPKTVDVQMAVKARRALEGIIEVSDQIKKSGEKLKKLSAEKE